MSPGKRGRKGNTPVPKVEPPSNMAMSETQLFMLEQIRHVNDQYDDTQKELGELKSLVGGIVTASKSKEQLLLREFELLRESVTDSNSLNRDTFKELSGSITELTKTVSKAYTALAKIEKVEDMAKHNQELIEGQTERISNVANDIGVQNAKVDSKLKISSLSQKTRDERVAMAVSALQDELKKATPSIENANKLKWGIAGIIILLTMAALLSNIYKNIQPDIVGKEVDGSKIIKITTP